VDVLSGTPRLLTAFLIARNRAARATPRNLLFATLSIAALVAAIGIGRATESLLDWLGSHALASGAVSGVSGAMLAARSRVLKRTQFSRSWLAAVPIRKVTALLEAVLIETLPATALIAALAAICAPRWQLWGYLSGGMAIGSLASYAIPAPRPVDLPPGSRYVPHRRVKGPPLIRPSLKAVGFWPLRQMFAWAQPKMVARATIPVLLAMPIGTMADTAMAVIGFFAIAGALLLLVSAVISTGAKLRRWAAPLPLRAGVLLRYFLTPTLIVIAVLGAALRLAALLMRS
jgi:hypothetical protein